MSKRKRSRGKNSSARQIKKNRRPAKSTLSSRDKFAAVKSPAQERFRTHSLPLIILIFISLLAYANAWPNNLTWDDGIFAIGDRLSGVGFADLGHFFTDDVWASIGADTGLYRPLLLVSFAIDIQLFGDWVAGFHLVNILLHALATIAVYGFVRHLLLASGGKFPISSSSAMLAALVFAVHPVHTEVVNSIFNRSEMLVTLGVVGGLWWFLQTEEKYPRKAWSVLSLIYLLVMFCRETGIVLPAITVAVLWIITPGNWQLRLRRCIPVFWLLIPLAVYLGLRAYALETPLTFDEIASNTPTRERAALGLPVLGMYFDIEKVLPAITVWFDALKLMLWPHPLFTFHNASETNRWIALTLQVALFAFAFMRLIQKKPALFIGLTFFYLSILPSSRILGEFSTFPHLAERYLYMPSVGMSIALASGFSWLAQRTSLKPVLAATFVVLIILMPLTWARNAQWASTTSLAEADYRNGARSSKILENLIASLRYEDNLSRASALCEKHADAFTRRWYLAVVCGQVYMELHRYNEAERTLIIAMNDGNGKAPAHYSLALMYVHLNRNHDAGEQFEQAVAAEKKAFMKAYLEAEMLIRLYPSQRVKLLEAKARLEETIRLQPQYHQARQRLAELNDILNSAKQRRN